MGIEQLVDLRVVTQFAGQPERGHAVDIGKIGMRTSLEQGRNQFRIVAFNRPGQRAGAEIAAQIGIGPCPQCRQHPRCIAVMDRRAQGCIRRKWHHMCHRCRGP